MLIISESDAGYGENDSNTTRGKYSVYYASRVSVYRKSFRVLKIVLMMVTISEIIPSLLYALRYEYSVHKAGIAVLSPIAM